MSFVQVYDKLAELQDQPPSIQRILDQPIILAGKLHLRQACFDKMHILFSEIDVGYPSINQALEEMVNQTKYLPSFGDVLDTVEKTNDKEQLHLKYSTLYVPLGY